MQLHVQRHATGLVLDVHSYIQLACSKLEAARADGGVSCCFHGPNLRTPLQHKLYRCVSELAFEWCSEIIRRTHAQLAAVSSQPPRLNSE